MKNILFIAWESYNRRPELLAQHFNAKTIYVSYGQKGNLVSVPFRYLIQTWKTWQVLRKEKPDVIYVQNPPIICSLVVCLYCEIHKSHFMIDSHTGAFVSWKWRWSLGLHRLLSRRALITFVHNKSQEKIIKDWGCRYVVLSFPPGDYPVGEDFPMSNGFNIAVIGSILEDEPIDIVFDAARQMPDVNFYITGNSKRIDAQTLSKKPANCNLTGFMSYEKYVGLLRNVDVILTLTTRDHTLLQGGMEAISLEQPLIVSDWPILRDFFPKGALFVKNTVEGICEGINLAKQQKTALQQEMSLLHNDLEENWKHIRVEIQGLIDGVTSND